MNIDLHTHSYFSDGEYSPEEVIFEAKKNNVSMLSITDHNVVEYDENVRRVAKISNVFFVEGIEISTLYRSSDNIISLHILGYSKDFNRALLRQTLQETINGYNARARKIIDKLNREFSTLHLDFEKIREGNHETYISRNTLARLLTEHAKNLSIKDALRQYVFVEEDDSWMIKTEGSFQLIERAGGAAVLAHSGRELRRIGLVAYEKMIQQFVLRGLRGLEVYYPKHTPEEICVIKDIAKKYRLYITGGSDWHGPIYTPNITMGTDNNEKDIIPFLKDIVGISL